VKQRRLARVLRDGGGEAGAQGELACCGWDCAGLVAGAAIALHGGVRARPCGRRCAVYLCSSAARVLPDGGGEAGARGAAEGA
jgi:hypothetical protein